MHAVAAAGEGKRRRPRSTILPIQPIIGRVHVDHLSTCHMNPVLSLYIWDAVGPANSPVDCSKVTLWMAEG